MVTTFVERSLLIKISQKHNLSDEQMEKFSLFLKNFNVGDILFPSTLKSILRLELVTTYRLLEDCKKQGMLSIVYNVHCHKCGQSTNIMLETLTNMDKTEQCINCKSTLNAIDDTVVLFKIANDLRVERKIF